MAYVSQSEQDQIIPAPVTASPTTGGQGVAGSSKAANTPGQNQPQQPSAQLSAYLNANQPQAAGLASTVAGQLGSQVSNAQNAINPAVNVYTGQLYTAPTDTATNQIVSTAPSTLSADQTASFQTELGASAAAPNSANTFETTQPYQGLTSDIQKAVSTANLWNAGNDPASLSTALQPYESPGATQGDTTLDALLLSQSAPAYQQIHAAAAPAANLQGNLATATASADKALRDAITQDNATTAAATAAPQTYATNLNTYLQTAINDATQGNTAMNAKILQDLTTNTPTQQDLNALGISASDWATLSGEMAAASSAGVPISLAAYLTQTAPTGFTAGNLANSTQYADVAALQNTMGGNAPVEPISSVTANQASTAPTNFNQFNLSDAEKAASNNATVKALEDEAQSLSGELNNEYSNYMGGNTGGVSPGDFNSWIAGQNAQLASYNAQIKAILGNSPGYVPGTQIPTPPGSPSLGDQAKSYVPVISDISNVASDIGSFFGFAEGGEVQNPKNLSEYLAGAK
jgi:hypothetical protein